MNNTDIQSGSSKIIMSRLIETPQATLKLHLDVKLSNKPCMHLLLLVSHYFFSSLTLLICVCVRSLAIGLKSSHSSLN